MQGTFERAGLLTQIGEDAFFPAERELRREQDRDLEAFGVRFDHFSLESSLYTDGRVDATEHTAAGTRIKARVPIPLAASLKEFATF